MKHSKKSQVTIFLIVAVVLLLAAGIFFLLNQRSQTISVVERELIKQDQISSEFQPISTFISECLTNTADLALIKVGQTGGYVSLDNPLLNGNANLEGLYVDYIKDTSDKIVYWRYYDKPFNRFRSKAPPLEGDAPDSITNQISNYIESEIDSCLNNFESFQDQGFTFETLPKKAITTLTDTEVAILLEFPVKITKSNANVDIERFATKIPVNLRDIYQLAQEITNLEDQSTFFENKLNLLISLKSGGSPYVPPKDDQYPTYTPKFWILSDVRDSLREEIQANFRTFRMVDADADLGNFEIPTPITSAAIIDNNNLDVRFDYLADGNFDWPFELDLCGKQVCQTESCSPGVFPLPCQSIRVSYNLNFPTLVEILQPLENNREYRFRFFLQANLRNNVPLSPSDSPLSPQFPQVSLLSDRDTWNSEEKTIQVIDATTGQPIADAPIYFKASDEGFLIDSTNSEGQLITSLPDATILAQLSSNPQNYISNKVYFDPGLLTQDQVTIELEPLQTKKVSLTKLVFKKGLNWYLDRTLKNMEKGETAVITLTKKNQEDNPYVISVEVQGGTPDEDLPEIQIANGEYEAEINLISRDIVSIPPSRPCGKFLVFNVGCADIPEINLGLPDESNIHLYKLSSLPTGSHQYRIKCVDNSKLQQDPPEDNPIQLSTVSFSTSSISSNPDLIITPKTPASFDSRSALLAVQTNKNAECRFRDVTFKERILPNEPVPEVPSRSGFEEYEEFVTSGLIHASYQRKSGNTDYDIICKESSSDEWILLDSPISITVNNRYGTNSLIEPDPDPEDSRTLQINPISVSSFTGPEAYIAVETSQKTSCTFAPYFGSEPEARDYIPMAISTEARYPEGGFKGDITLTDIQDKGDILEFKALDMGLDELSQSRRTIQDLDHLFNIDEESRDWASRLQPRFR
tara:strand:+ start:1118 stop:3880 length:2763 start_codon:yes stop_codon:yes gene_type:complete